MSIPTPSTPAPEGPQPESASVDSPSLSPLSPDTAVKLEPLLASDSDKAALVPGPLERANASSDPGKSKKRKNSKPYRWAIWTACFLIFLVAAGVFGLAYAIAASISGTEFNAVNWTTREFSFMRDPFSEMQLTNIQHSSGRFSVDAAIAPHIAGGPARPTVSRWDLVEIYRGMSPGKGKAHILLEYLQTLDHESDNYWVEWTNGHPKAAPILWGAVRDVVHLERYDRIPEIFDQVRVDDDPKALKNALAKVMLKLSLEEARARVKAGDQAAAGRAAMVGLSYGESEELRKLTRNADQAK